MSRTYRRTKRGTPEWVKRDHYWDNKRWSWVDTPLKGQELKESIARYHADKPSGYYNAPAGFRKDVNKSFRAKMNMVTKMCEINGGDHDEYGYEVYKHNCNWYYW